MNNKASITALMSAFGRAYHAENEQHHVFADNLAKELMSTEEYTAVQNYMLGGAQFFEPQLDPTKQPPDALLRKLVNVHIAPSPLCRAAYTEQALKAAAKTGTQQYVILGAGWVGTSTTQLSYTRLSTSYWYCFIASFGLIFITKLLNSSNTFLGDLIFTLPCVPTIHAKSVLDT